MEERRNVLFVLSDDQGEWALGSSGNPEIHTPHLDELAQQGVRFENFFCASPVCSPARASLLTGQIPSGHGVHDWITSAADGRDDVDYLADQLVMTDVFAAAGYRVGLVGKFHLGASDQPRNGYDHWVALDGGGSPYRGATVFRGSKPERVDGYLTEFFADESISFLRGVAADKRRFFLSLNFTAPHKPWKGQHPREFERLYDSCEFKSCPQGDPHPWLATREGHAIAGEADTRAALVGYFAAVSAMDDAIGRVLGAVSELGLADDTIVVFSSDNGFNCGHHGIWGKGNGTFPQNMFDTSVKVPLIISCPSRLAAGSVRLALTSAYDLPATLLELVGLDPEPFERGPGRSFAAMLDADADDSSPRPVVVYDEYGPTRMIRTNTEKYIHRYPFGPHEFYDLEVDPWELENRVECSDDQPRVTALRQQLRDWFLEHAVPEMDGAALPVTGGGQTGALRRDGIGAFLARE